MTTHTETDEDRPPGPPDLEAEIAALRRELKSVLAHLQQLGTHGAEAAKHEAWTRLSDSVGQGEKAAKEAAEALRGEWDALEGRLRAETRDHPLRSLGLAVLGGMVLGLLMRR